MSEVLCFKAYHKLNEAAILKNNVPRVKTFHFEGTCFKITIDQQVVAHLYWLIEFKSETDNNYLKNVSKLIKNCHILKVFHLPHVHGVCGTCTIFL